MSTERIGDWIQVSSGLKFYPMDPDPREIRIQDIAHSLSLQCRYAGHCISHYSVAQHSVIVAAHCDPENQRWGIMHDATEAYLCDVPRPIKPYLQGYKEAEERMHQTIAVAFNLPDVIPPQVKEIDNRIICDERRCLFENGHDLKWWSDDLAPLKKHIAPWKAEKAEEEFLIFFEKYFGMAAVEFDRLMEETYAS